MKVVVHALGEKGLHTLQALALCEWKLDVRCVIGTDAAVQNDYSEAIVAFCAGASIPFTTRQNSQARIAADEIAVAAGWRWMIRNTAAEKLIVFHDSLLPRYRGFAPVVNALLKQEPNIGVTALFGANEYDTGNVIAQKQLAVTYPTTVADQTSRIARLYGEVAREAFARLAANPEYAGVPQAEDNASYSLWRDDDDYRVDWSQSATVIAHTVACLGYPYLGASTEISGELVRLHSVAVEHDVRIENRCPGKVIFLRGSSPVVVCGEGLLRIDVATHADGASIFPLASFRTRFA